MSADSNQPERTRYTNGRLVVDEQALNWPNSYSEDKPGFLIRGYYQDEPFTCKDCGREEVWTARKQKWWYEVAKGGILTKAIRCRDCRQKRKLPVSGRETKDQDGLSGSR